MEFLNAIGYTVDGFEPITVQDSAHQDLQYDDDDLIGQDPVQLSVNVVDGPRFHRTKDGKIKPTLPNIVLALTHQGYLDMRLARDAYRNEIVVGTAEAHRSFTDEDYTLIRLTLSQKGFGPGPIPSQDIREAVRLVARQQSFDSAINWLNGLPPWDGTPRIASFCSRYLGAPVSAYSTAVSLYWWTAHAGRILSPGIQADMAIVLISRQGTGKTSAIKAIAPTPDQYVELNLMDRDEDLSRTMRGKLIGEMAELRGIATREMEGIKAWISRQREEWVPKYEEFSKTFPRRLVLIGTSNQDEFLADETGNRRWLPLQVGERQDRDAIICDRDRLWAEARAVYLDQGILWQEAERLAKDEHESFMITDPWQDTLENWLATPDLDGSLPCERDFLLVSDILRDALHIDSGRVRLWDKQRIGKILRVLGYKNKVWKVNKRNQKVWSRNQMAWNK